LGSTKSAASQLATPLDDDPKAVKLGGYPFPYVVEYVTEAVVIARRLLAAAASFAAMRARRKLGIAIAAIIKMIATTIKSSISENPEDAFFPVMFLTPDLDSRMSSHPGFQSVQKCEGEELAFLPKGRKMLTEGPGWQS
jgi:hypothetical protein